jgi:histidyl-tRNA synthetase
MFRRERPQRGRYRQFHQIGAEALGYAGPELDAELILLAVALWRELGLSDWRLEINSLGQPEERALHRAELIAYLEQHEAELDEEAKRRLHSNPLRILDTKNPTMQALVNGAPRLIDFLGASSLAHFDSLKAMLDANGVPWTFNPRLVRGLDYYNLSVFEFVTDRLGAQGTICAGGRYDYLIAQMGGKPAPAVGWALGVERVLDLLKEQGTQPELPAPDAFAVVPDAAALPQVLQCLQALRAAGVSVQMHAPAGAAEGMDQFFPPASRIFLQTHAWPLLLRNGEFSELYLQLQSENGQAIPVMANARISEVDGTPEVIWLFFIAVRIFFI